MRTLRNGMVNMQSQMGQNSIVLVLNPELVCPELFCSHNVIRGDSCQLLLHQCPAIEGGLVPILSTLLHFNLFEIGVTTREDG